MRLTSIQATVSFLADDPPEGSQHALPLIVLARNMHPALHRDIRVRDTGREQLTQRTHVKRVLGRNPPLALQHVLHLLKHGVLQDGVDNEDQRRRNTSEQAQRALLADQREQRGKRAGSFGGRRAREDLLVGLGLAGRHARVDDPDGVCEEHGCRAGDGAGNHGLDGGELAGGAAGLERGFFEEGASPFVPWAVSISSIWDRGQDVQ